MPYRELTESQWRAHVVQRLDAQDLVLATNGATLKRMEGLLDAWTAVRVGGAFFKWVGGIIIVGLAVMGYFAHK